MSVFSRAKAGRRDTIGHHDASLETGAAKVIAKRWERHMNSVCDKAEPKFFMQAKSALNDILVPWQQRRTAVT